MNAEAIATQNWVRENVVAFDAKSLGAPEKNRQYLENRLVRAFQEGMKKGREIEAEETKRRIIQRLFT